MPSNTQKLAKIKLDKELPALPCGYYVLVELVEVEPVSDGGIVLPKAVTQKEQSAEEVGYIRAIGPTAYKGYEGCDSKTPASDWGVQVGDLVEFRAFEGKKCVVPGYELFRYIPDSQILAVINEVS